MKHCLHARTCEHICHNKTRHRKKNEGCSFSGIWFAFISFANITSTNRIPTFIERCIKSIPLAWTCGFLGIKLVNQQRNSSTTSQVNSLYLQIIENGRVTHVIDARDEKYSNWLRFVNCARNDVEQNLVAFQFRGEIYYRSFKTIEPGMELLVWYGDRYACDLDILNKDESEKMAGMCSSVTMVWLTWIFVFYFRITS